MGLGGPRGDPEDEKKQDQKKASDAASSGSKGGKSQGRGGVALGLGAPPDPGTFRPRQIVAVGLPPHVLRQLVQRNFRVLSGSDSAVAVLRLPETETASAWDMQRALEKDFGPNFGLNYVYKPYQKATEERHALQLGRAGPKPPGGACPADRCYGRELIRWNDTLARCAEGIRVGMIDTLVDKSHRAFAGRDLTTVTLEPGHDAAPPDGHGTGVLSVMAGAPDSSTPGLIPNAQFTAVGAFFTNAEGRPETDTRHLLDALNVLSAQKVHVINMSLVGPEDDLVHERIKEMAATDAVVFVAAAGNGGPGAGAGYPAAYEEVIAVTAVDRRQSVYDFANRGSYIDVAAPGVKIWTAQPGQREGMLSGTSLAAPFVSAIVAVSYDDAGLRKPRRGALDPKSMILSHLYGDQTKRDSTYGLGVVKAPTSCGKQLWASVVSRTPSPRPPEAAAQEGWGPTVTRVSVPAEGRR